MRYDALDQTLHATPFTGGLACWNAADWIVIIAPICLFPIIIGGAICSWTDVKHALDDRRQTLRLLKYIFGQWHL